MFISYAGYLRYSNWRFILASFKYGVEVLCISQVEELLRSSSLGDVMCDASWQ